MNQMYDYTNGAAISVVIKEEIKRFIKEYCKKYPNDASLGEEIRKLNNNE